MYYRFMGYGYLHFMEKKAKIYRLLKFYMEPEEATNALEVIAPLIKEASDDYLQGMVASLRRRLRDDDGLRRIRNFLEILKTMGSALSRATTIIRRTTSSVEIPMVPANRLKRRSRIESPFRCTQLSKDVLSNDYDDFTSPRSVHYFDHTDPTTVDYGSYYGQEYNEAKDYLQALRAQEAADAEALREQEEVLRAQEAALRVQQGAGQGQVVQARPHYLQLHLLTMPMTTCHLRGWSLQVYLQEDPDSLGDSDNNSRTTSD